MKFILSTQRLQAAHYVDFEPDIIINQGLDSVNKLVQRMALKISLEGFLTRARARAKGGGGGGGGGGGIVHT